MFEIIPFILLGAFVGFIAGLLGIGGGLVMVPALLYFLAPKVEQSVLMHTAIATSLAVIVFTSISSVYAHNKHNAIIWPIVVKLLPSVIFGAYSGAMIAKYMSFDFLRLLFGLFELSMAFIIWFGVSTTAHAEKLSHWFFLIVGYFIGLLSSIFGIGGGIMSTPFLVYNNVKIKNAIAISATIGMPIAIAGSIGFIVIGIDVEDAKNGLGFINLEAFLSIVFASVLCAPIGAKVTHIVDSTKLKKSFAIFIAFLGLRVLFF